MGIFDPAPILFVFYDGVLNLVVWCGASSLDQDSGIDLIGKDTNHRLGTPLTVGTCLKGGLIIDAGRALMFRRGQNATGVQLVRYDHRAHSLNLPSENIPDNFPGHFIYDELRLIIRGPQVSIGSVVGDKFSVSSPALKVASHLDRNITAVRIVEEILNRNDQAVAGRKVQAVEVIVDRDEAHTELGKDLLNITACIDILSSKSGQVLHNDAVDLTRLHSLHHFLKLWPLKIRARVAVVTEFRDQLDVRLLCYKPLDDGTLAGNTVALRFICGKRKVAVFLRESKVVGGFIYHV